MSDRELTTDRPRKDATTHKDAAPESLLATDFVSGYLDGYVEYQDVSTEVLVTLLILNMVTKPELMRVTITKSVNTVVLEFDVADSDKGRVIGKDGRTIVTLRHLSRAVAGSSGKEYFIRLLADDRPQNKSESYQQTGNRRSYHER